MPKSKSLPWVEKFREKQKEMGRKRRPEKYLTDEEHEFLNQKLIEFRKEKACITGNSER